MSDANDNPPCEREWTIEEREEFFTSQDAVTGLFSGAVANNAASSWMNTRRPTGIHVTSISPPEYGWPVAFYCPRCKETVFLWSPWAIKPKDGDYWKMNEMCVSEEYGHKHNLEMIKTEWYRPIWLSDDISQ